MRRLRRDGLKPAQHIALRERVLGEPRRYGPKPDERRRRAFLEARKRILGHGDPDSNRHTPTPEQFEAFLKARKRLIDR